MKMEEKNAFDYKEVIVRRHKSTFQGWRIIETEHETQRNQNNVTRTFGS